MANVEHLDGTEVQGWLLSKIIGRGADGIVYRGEKDGTAAAVKLFFPEPLAKNGLPAARERLDLQLSLVGKKHHPNLVEVYAGGEDTHLGTLFLIMELVPGTSLDKLVGKVPPRAVIPLAAQLAAAAQYLETLDLVHRDIKPANVVISDDFTLLTLLDLGIVYQLPDEDDQGRLSGMEFVSTLRYSPPEFVWRTEREDIDGAWRAVTFYQIGATLHDMIMCRLLFSGDDTPRARLYDSVRDRTPVLEAKEVEDWLLQTVQACLLKDWRQRLQLLSWDSFSTPVSPTDAQQLERRIRLRQIRNEEMRQASTRQRPKALGPTREQQLWSLNNGLILEIRKYLLSTHIFPQCRVFENSSSEREYGTHFHFESDIARGFQPGVTFTVILTVDANIEVASKLSFQAKVGDRTYATAAWTEMFTVEAAFLVCKQSFLDAVDSLLTM